MNEKPKILIVLARFPYPATDGTKIKILSNIVEALREDFIVEFLIISIEKIKKNDIEIFKQKYGEVKIFEFSKIRFFLNSFSGFFSKKPIQVVGFYFPIVQDWVSRNIDRYDLVFLHTIRVAEYFANRQDKDKIILDFNDALSLNYKDSKNYARFPLNIIYKIEEPRMKDYENKMLRLFKNFNVISNYDKQYILNNAKDLKIEMNFFETIPFGTLNLATSREENYDQSIYFIGSLKYEMNLNAVQFFLDEIWQRLKEKIPTLQFFIIGQGQNELEQKYNNSKDVHFLGFQENPDTIIAKCACSIAPILSGAGMPTKIVQAFGGGVPVVTTPIGARGFALANNNENIIIIDPADKDMWVDKIVSLVTDHEVNKKISKNAKILFENEYELSVVQQKWKDFCIRVLKNKST